MQKRYYFFIVLVIVMLAMQMMWPFGMQSLDYFGQYISLLLPAILYVVVTKTSFKETFKLRSINMQTLLLTVASFIALQPIMAFVASINNSLHISLFGEQSLQAAMPSSTGMSLIVSLFVTAITPAICEEFVMRGVMLPNRFKTSIHKMALLNGVLFGIFHFNFPQLAYPIVLGIVVTYFVLITKSILPAVIIHFLNNAMSTLAEFSPAFGKIFYGYEQGPSFIANNPYLLLIYQFVLACLAGGALVVIILRLMKANNYDKSSHELSEDTAVQTKGSKLINAIPIVLIALIYFQLVFNNSPMY